MPLVPSNPEVVMISAVVWLVLLLPRLPRALPRRVRRSRERWHAVPGDQV